MKKPLIIITGKDGQLGFELSQLQKYCSAQFDFLFTNREDLNLLNEKEIEFFIEKHQPNYFINTAAYTLVDKAETEKDLAYLLNSNAPAIIAKICTKINCQFIHISTDYVFDGNKKEPYLTNDKVNPLNIYGASKAEGERLVIQNNPKAIVIRTSWVYSTHGKNFVKTMLKLMQEKDELNIVSDQIGSPTYAADLATAIIKIIVQLDLTQKLSYSNIYHYSNTGNISWYQFAIAIKEISNSKCNIKPIDSSSYPTPAKRSKYSVLNNSNIVKDFDVEIVDWKKSLKKLISLIV